MTHALHENQFSTAKATKMCMPIFEEAFVHHLECIVRAGPPETEWYEWFKDIPGYRFWVTATAVIDLKIGKRVIRATDVDLPFPPEEAWGPINALTIEFELLDLQGCPLKKVTELNGNEYYETNQGRLKLVNGPVAWIKGLYVQNASDQVTVNIGKVQSDGSRVVTLNPRDALCCDREQNFPSLILRAKVVVDQQRAHALQCGPCVDECSSLRQKLATLGRAELRRLVPRIFSLTVDAQLALLYEFLAFQASSAGLPYCQDNAAAIQRSVNWSKLIERVLTRYAWTTFRQHAAACPATPPDPNNEALYKRVLETVRANARDWVMNESVSVSTGDVVAPGTDEIATYAAVDYSLQVIADFIDNQLNGDFVFAGKFGSASSASESHKQKR